MRPLQPSHPAHDRQTPSNSRRSTRIHQSHSRSRSFLALPFSSHYHNCDTTLAVRRSSPSKLLAKLLYSPSSCLRPLTLLLFSILAFLLLRRLHTPLPISTFHIPAVPHFNLNTQKLPLPLAPPPPATNNTAATTTNIHLIAPNKNNTSKPPHAPLQYVARPADAPQTKLAPSTAPSSRHQLANSTTASQPENPPRQLAAILPPPPSSAKQTQNSSSSIAIPPHSPKRHPVPDFRDPADFSTFTRHTSLNYFHLHKTGGVSFKARLFDFFNLEKKINDRGLRVKVFDTCHTSGPSRKELGMEAEWSCDWREIKELAAANRTSIDVIVGHQYWEHGAGHWIANRDLRYFTVMRHPLHRKISFYYHFFVRNAGKSEDSVTANQLIQFVLGKNMPKSNLIRDAGPGYYASRLWSDGLTGFNQNHYVIPDDRADTMVSNSISRLRRNFVFIGLQTQEKASLCMLKKTVEAFANTHGFQDLKGLALLAKQRERMNTGSYALSGDILWQKMTEEQRTEYKRIEKVDLGIYKESVKMFHETAKKFQCHNLVVARDDDNIAL